MAETVFNNGNIPLPNSIKLKPSPLNNAQMEMYDEEEYQLTTEGDKKSDRTLSGKRLPSLQKITTELIVIKKTPASTIN